MGTNKGLWSEQQEKEWKNESKKKVLEAFARSEKLLKPNWKEMFTEVYDEIPVDLQTDGGDGAARGAVQRPVSSQELQAIVPSSHVIAAVVQSCHRCSDRHCQLFKNLTESRCPALYCYVMHY